MLDDKASAEALNEMTFGLPLAIGANGLTDVNATSGIQTQAYSTSVIWPGGGDQVLHPVNGAKRLRQAQRSHDAVRVCSTFGYGLLRIIALLIKRLAPITDEDLVFCCASYSVTLITTGTASDPYPYLSRLRSFRVSPWPRHPVASAQAPYPNCPVAAPNVACDNAHSPRQLLPSKLRIGAPGGTSSPNRTVSGEGRTKG